MIKFTTQKLEMESNLKQRIEFICEFCHIKPTIINSSIKRINNTNLNYLEPHKIIVNNIAFCVKTVNIKITFSRNQTVVILTVVTHMYMNYS